MEVQGICSDKWLYLLQHMKMLQRRQQVDEKRKESALWFWYVPGKQNATLPAQYTCVICGNSFRHNFYYCFPILLRAHLETQGSFLQKSFTVFSETSTGTGEGKSHCHCTLNAVLNKQGIFSHTLLSVFKVKTLLTLAPCFSYSPIKQE